MPRDLVDTDHPELLATAIRVRREQLGLRMEDVASVSGLSLTTVRRVEGGQDMTVSTLRAIAKALSTTIAQLLSAA